MRKNFSLIVEIEVILSFISFILHIITNDISIFYKYTILLLFELISCIIVSFLHIIESKVNSHSLIPAVALISYSILNGFIGTILTLFTAFFLGAYLIDFGTIILSVYFGLVTFRTCIFTGFKSLLVMIIKR